MKQTVFCQVADVSFDHVAGSEWLHTNPTTGGWAWRRLDLTGAGAKSFLLEQAMTWLQQQREKQQ